MRPRWTDVKRTLINVKLTLERFLEHSGGFMLILRSSEILFLRFLPSHFDYLPIAISSIITDFFNVFELSRYLLEN